MKSVTDHTLHRRRLHALNDTPAARLLFSCSNFPSKNNNLCNATIRANYKGRKWVGRYEYFFSIIEKMAGTFRREVPTGPDFQHIRATVGWPGAEALSAINRAMAIS